MRKLTENVQKLTFLANEYKGSDLQQIYQMFQIPLIDFENAVSAAVDLGYLSVSKTKKRGSKFEVLETPEHWEFGDDVQDTINAITFAFQTLEKSETDLEENELNSWMAGYPTQDQFVAVKWLINQGFLDTYEIKISNKELKLPDTTQTYYCLAGNKDKKWGKKQIHDKSRIIG